MEERINKRICIWLCLMVVSISYVDAPGNWYLVMFSIIAICMANIVINVLRLEDIKKCRAIRERNYEELWEEEYGKV